MHATLGHCPAKDLPADALENCIRDLMISFVSDDEFLEATYNQIKFNIQEKINKFDKDLKGLWTNYSRKETEKNNLLIAIKDGSKNIKSIEGELETIEGELVFLSNNITTKKKKRISYK